MSQKELEARKPFATSIKITFGTKPGCGAGKGVCQLLQDDNILKDKEIRVLAYHDCYSSSVMFQFSLKDFKERDEHNYDIFISDTNPLPIKHFLAQEHLIEPYVKNVLKLCFDAPKFEANSIFYIYVDNAEFDPVGNILNGTVRMTFFYSE